MNKIKYLLFIAIIIISCEKEDTCNSNIGTLIIENKNVYPYGEIAPLFISIYEISYELKYEEYFLVESYKIDGLYHIFDLKEGKYRIECEWFFSRFHKDFELYINACNEKTLYIPGGIIN